MNEHELRQALIDSLIERKILTSPWTVRAFQEVPRHLFVPQVPLEEAYEDKVILHKMVDDKLLSTASQPSMIGIMLEQLGLRPGHKVLEIGAGTGYNAALMAAIVGEEGLVVTIDIDDDLVDGARACLDEAGFPQVKTVCADGGYGYAEDAPYDRSILTVSATDVTPAWLEQLKDDGRIVMPLSILQKQVSVALEKEQIQVDVAGGAADEASESAEGTEDLPESQEQHEVTRLRAISRNGCNFVTLRGEYAVYPDKDEPEEDEPEEDEPEKDEPEKDEPEVESEQEVEEAVNDLEVFHYEDFVTDIDQVRRWLSGPYKEHPTDVTLNIDLFGEYLWTWLYLHNLPMVRVDARDRVAEGGLMPVTVRYADGETFVSTSGLISETGMALFASPLSIATLALDLNPYVRQYSYRPMVRAYGDGQALAERLVEVCQAWQEEGQPSLADMEIYVYPNTPRELMGEHRFVVEKRWSFVGLDYSITE